MASASSGRAANKKVKGAPDYDDPGFWDTRFATGQDVGEWLNSGETLIETVLSDLEKRQPIESGSEEQRRPRVLHLGPGVSRLGSKLRDKFVERGWRGDGIVVSFPSAYCPVLKLNPCIESRNYEIWFLIYVARMSTFPLKLCGSDRSSNQAKKQLTPCIGFGLICVPGVIYPLL